MNGPELFLHNLVYASGSSVDAVRPKLIGLYHELIETELTRLETELDAAREREFDLRVELEKLQATWSPPDTPLCDHEVEMRELQHEDALERQHEENLNRSEEEEAYRRRFE